MKIKYKPNFGLRVEATLGNTYPAQIGDALEVEVNGNTPVNGIGRLEGIVEVDEVLVSNSLVRLYVEDTREYVDEMLTDANGKFLFDGLNMNKKYFLVANDPIKKYEYRVSSRRIPVI